MRRFRRLILVLIVAILVGVGITYKDRLLVQSRDTQPPHAALPENVSAQANAGWNWSQTDPKVEVHADSFQQIAEPAHFELTGVEIHFFHKDKSAYDRVKSAHA